MNQSLTQPPPSQIQIPSKKIWVIILTLVLFIAVTIGLLTIISSRKKTQPQIQTAETSQFDTAQQQSFSDISDIFLDQTSQTPETTVNKFLTLIQKNQRQQAKTLISQQANQQAFTPTLQNLDPPQSLYGKQFTFRIINTQTEVQQTISRVEVQINQNNQTSYRTLVLLNTTGSWLLVDQEIHQISSANQDQEQPISP